MTEYEPREFSITGTVRAPESVGAEQLAESLKRGLEQSRLGATVDLGDFTKYATDAAEPEDKDDLYVEPEPLKEGAEPAFNDDDVHHLKVISGSTTVFDGLALFEEADNGNITVTPVPRCTSLKEKAGSILRCGRHEGHGDGHWTVGSTPAAAWSDERAYGRVVESGGAS